MNTLASKKQFACWRWVLETILVLDLIVIGFFGLAALVIWPESKITQNPSARDFSITSEVDFALQSYKAQTGGYPSTKQGLQALVTRPDGVSNWRGPYLKTIPLDHWGHPYQYAYPSTHGQPAGKYDCWSLGPHGKDGMADEISNWPTAL